MFEQPNWMSDELWELWQEWNSYKTEINSCYKTIWSERSALKRLRIMLETGQDVIAAINEAMENGWKSFYERKPKREAQLNTNNQNELLKIGQQIGVNPQPGESWGDYKRRLEQMRRH